MLNALETLIQPLYWVVSAVLMGWHWLFDLGLPADSGWTWALSIIGLTVTTRAALIPLFVKQIKSSRNMQMLQPRVKELQKKYGHDRERLAQETMALYKDAGTNPFASCLPILMQAPIFFALFRVISEAARDNHPLGILTLADTESLEAAELSPLPVTIADTFLGADNSAVVIVTLVLVAVMTATTFTTQRQLMRKNMPESALTGPYAQQQKMLLYVLPVVFAVGGIAFPIGVLLYWSTSNLWTMAQQFYVIRNNPAPGTPAEEAKRQRDIKHGRIVETAPEPPPKSAEPARQQPKKVSRDQRRKGGQTPPRKAQPPPRKGQTPPRNRQGPSAKGKNPPRKHPGSSARGRPKADPPPDPSPT